MSNLLLTLANRAAPEMYQGMPVGLPYVPTARQILYAERLWNLRQDLLGPHPRDGEGDVEDFWEMAAVLDAAIHSGAQEVWLQGAKADRLLRGKHNTASLLTIDERLDLPEDHPESMKSFGPIPEGSPLWQRAEVKAADRYADWPVFKEWARRATAVVGVHLGPSHVEREMWHVLSDWVRDGVVAEGEEIIVKATRAKHGMWAIPAHGDMEEAREAIREALGWSAVHFEGMPGAFLIQQRVPMTHEYRVFIVDGEPVTGAGCIEEFTPLYSSGRDFDFRTREHRNAFFRTAENAEDEIVFESSVGKPITDSFRLVKRYFLAAEEIAKAVPAGELVIDLAYNPDTDEVLMIEANGLSNSGLYASQPLLVAEALFGNEIESSK